MDCNKEVVMKAKQIAERRIQMGDYEGARNIALKAQRICPELKVVSQLLAVCDVHCAAETKLFESEKDLYKILQIEPSAEEGVIEKQYKKLSLLLHPDKNRIAGAEDAFKLIVEARGVLTDKIKREIYDMKCRIYLSSKVPKQQEHQSNGTASLDKQFGTSETFSNAPNFPQSGKNDIPAASCPQPAASNSVPRENQATFWTCCPHCEMWYEYYRKHVNREFRCMRCQLKFVGSDLCDGGLPPGFPASETPNQKKAPTQAPSTVTSPSNSELPRKNPSENSLGSCPPMSTTKCAFDAGSRPKENTEIHVAEGDGKGDDLLPTTGGVKPTQVESSVTPGEKKTRNSVDEPRESNNTSCGNSKEDNLVAQEINGDITGSNSAMNACKATTTSRPKRRVSEKQNSGDVDDVCHTLKKMKKGRSSLDEDEELKKTSRNAAISEDSDFACPDPLIDTSKKLTKQKSMGKAKEGKVGKSNHNDKSLENAISIFVLDPTEDKFILEYPNPDFHDFEKGRAESCFSVNQIWAVYDRVDGMPRSYVLVKSIGVPGFKLQLTWLSPSPHTRSLQDWYDVGLPVACGKYCDIGDSYDTDDRLIFSHLMDFKRDRGRNSYIIYPTKGETWAIFKKWSLKWSANPRKQKPPYEYEIVEIVSDYDSCTGITVAYLTKVDGFVGIFQPTGRQAVIQPGELYRFSHRIPSCIMNGRRRGVPAGCFELDSASLPSLSDAPSSTKTDKARVHGEAGGSFAREKSSQVVKCRNMHGTDLGAEFSLTLRRSPRFSNHGEANGSFTPENKHLVGKRKRRNIHQPDLAADYTQTPRRSPRFPS